MKLIQVLAIYVISVFAFTAKANDLPNAPEIKASAGRDCFKSLDAKDMENLGHILYLRERTAGAVYDPNKEDLEEQLKLINEKFTGEKRDAAFAILGKKIANRNEAKLRQVINQALYRGDTNLNDHEVKELSDLNKTALMNNLNLGLLLNLKTASLRIYADLLQSKGAKLLPNGQWSFGEKFDFSEVNKDPRLKEALAAFFPREVEELDLDGRGYVIIGDRVVIKEFDIKSKKRPTEWYWRSADIEEHSKKTVEIIDRFTKKAEEFARLGKENGHWIKVTDAALSGDAICGMSIKDIAIGALPGIGPLAQYYFSKQENAMTKWEKGIRKQMDVNQEMNDLLKELTLHGASEETKSTIRQAIFDLQRKSDVEMEGGLQGMKTALTAMALSPLAFLAPPIALPAAGSTALGAGLAYTGAALTVISLATPVVIATKNVLDEVKRGDGALCSIGKQIASVPVKAVDTLKWGAMGPIIKSLTPALKPVAAYLKLGPGAEKYAVIIPGSLIAGKGIYDNAKLTIEANHAISNIEKALDVARKEKNTSHANVLEQMLKEAKEQRWSHVLTLARSTVGVTDSVRKAIGQSSAIVAQQAPAAASTNTQSSSTQTSAGPTILVKWDAQKTNTTNASESGTNVFTFRSSSSATRSTSSISSSSSKSTTTSNSGPTTKINVVLKTPTNSETVYVGKNDGTGGVQAPPSPVAAAPAAPAQVQAPSLAPPSGAPGGATSAPEFQVDKTITGVIKNVKSGYSDEVGKQESEQKLKDKEKQAEEIKTKLEDSKSEVKKLEQEIQKK